MKNNELRTGWKEAVMPYFKVLLRYFKRLATY
jgi:hypothetical protein